MECDELEALVAENLTVRGIAARTACSPTNVRYWLKRHGLETTTVARRAARVPGERVLGECDVHGRSAFVITARGTRRCVRCRSEAVSQWRRRAKETLVVEAGGACTACGYDRCLAALQFHHLDPATKRFALSAQGITRAMATLREEAEKCVLLCSNCHAEVEAGILTLTTG